MMTPLVYLLKPTVVKGFGGLKYFGRKRTDGFASVIRIFPDVLARQELARRCKALQAQARETVALEEPRVLPEDAEAAAGYEPERPLDIIEQALEPPVVETKDLIPDVRLVPPDEALAQKELLEQLQKIANNWPKSDRDAFELYFVEGFEPEEIAMVLGQSTRNANELLTSIRARVRETLLAQSAV